MTDLLYSLALGVGLSAACGLRIFIPLLVMSVAAMTGWLPLAENLAWIGTTPALVAFGAAAGAEVIGYFIPWVDNALDAVATPAAMVAGTLASASVLGDASPAMQWGLASISGGGVAGLVQGGTVAARGASSASTGGLGNFVIAMGEGVGSVLLTVLALVAPVVVALAVFVLLVWAARKLLRRRRRARA